MSENPEIELQQRIEVLKKELEPIFDEEHHSVGHGTSSEASARRILEEGLLSKNRTLFSTTMLLENSEKGIKEILNWKHHDLKYIVVAMVRKDIPKSQISHFGDEHLWEELPDGDPNAGTGQYRLPSKYIRGYIDVDSNKLVLNTKYESNPETPEPLMPDSEPILRRGGAGEATEQVEIPRPPLNTQGAPDVW